MKEKKKEINFKKQIKQNQISKSSFHNTEKGFLYISKKR